MSVFLQQQEWSILARNWRRPGCELDIVASKGSTLIAVEVKGRKSPVEVSSLLPKRKQAALRRGLLRFLEEESPAVDHWRIDLAVVYLLPQPHCQYYTGVVPA